MTRAREGTTNRGARWRTARLRASGGTAAVLVVLGAVGCDVENPGAIVDQDLDRPEAFEALVAGAASEFAWAFNGGTSGLVKQSAELFGEMWAASSGLGGILRARGIGAEDRPDFNGFTDRIHRARWIAEDAVRRMQDVLGPQGGSDPAVAEGLLWAGIANRWLADVHCQVVFDGGEAQPRQVGFERAEDFFSQAIEMARATGREDVLFAAYGGRAQVRLILGNVQGAAADAREVPSDFEWVVHFNDVTQGGWQTNAVWHETHQRRELSAAITWFWEYALETEDPRVPVLDMNRPGADGSSPQWAQRKYPHGTANVPVITGEEMRLIEAEELILAGQWEAGLAMINALRAETDTELPPWEAANQREAFDALILERGIVNWLTGKRGGEFYRFNRLTEIFPGGYDSADDPFIRRQVELAPGMLPPDNQVIRLGILLENRHTCFSFSDLLISTNPNVSAP